MNMGSLRSKEKNGCLEKVFRIEELTFLLILKIVARTSNMLAHFQEDYA